MGLGALGAGCQQFPFPGATPCKSGFIACVDKCCPIVDLAQTPSSTCLLTSEGVVQCGGDDMGFGVAVKSLVAGKDHHCALDEAGAVKCWGAGFGASPVQIPGLESGAKAIASAKALYTCAITASDGVACWGDNRWNQLGAGGEPIPDSGVVNVKGLDAGAASLSVCESHACVVTTDGRIKCWGGNMFGQLGNGVRKYVPGEVTTGQDRAVDATVFNGVAKAVLVQGEARREPRGMTCALSSKGAVQCWGYGQYPFRLGNGLNQQWSLDAVNVVGLSSGAASFGKGHPTCVVTEAGGVKCWGDSPGDGTLGDRLSPVEVGLSSGVVRLTSELPTRVCAFMEDAGVHCWGDAQALSPTPLEL